MKTTVRIIVAFILLGMCVWTYFYLHRKQPFHIEPREPYVVCANNLRQIGLAFRIWETDHDGDVFPFSVSTNHGGVRELCVSDQDGFAKDATPIFKSMHVELGESPKVLVCPQDHKKVATSLDDINLEHITYRVHLGTNVNENNPSEVLAWCPVHGNRLLCDGSVVTAQGKSGELKAGTNGATAWSFRRGYADFSDAEKAKFLDDYTNRYAPVIAKWYKVYEGRLPFSPEEMTPDKFAWQSGTASASITYTFIINYVFLELSDANGSAQVDYLNDQLQTRRMTALLINKEAPITTLPLPLTREDLSKLLEADSGTRFALSKIRMEPRNGGAIVQVDGISGDPATWKYNMIFGADGKLALYSRNQDAEEVYSFKYMKNRSSKLLKNLFYLE